SISRTIAALQVFGADCLAGYMLQRVASDGALAAIGRDQTIWEAYPEADFNLSERMGVERAIWKSKFPLFRVGETTRRQRGNHLPPTGWPGERAPLRCVVHHFKWRDRLKASLAHIRDAGSGEHEYEAYRRWLAANHDRVPVERARRLGRADLFRIGL